MNSNFALNVPINPVSFGQISTAILREIYKLGLEPCVMPIGNVDLSCQPLDQDFNNWLQGCINKSLKSHNRKHPAFKLWHLNGGMESFSEKQFLYTFWETDSPTAEEINVVKNNAIVGHSSQYAIDILKDFGCDNLVKLQPGFDSFNFKRMESKKYYEDDRIVFSVVGKFEPIRKNHAKAIQAWIKRFGNSGKYWLHCAIHNPFVKPEEMQHYYRQLVGGKNVPNVQFFPFMQQNEVYNDWLNAADVVIGMGNESFGLPEFHSMAMGKHAVILNANGYKGYCNKDNSVLVNPNGKMDSHDGKFFFKGAPWNQGQFFTFNESEFITGCEEAIKRVRLNRVNEEGLKLMEKFSYEATTKSILENLEKLS